MNRSTVGYFLGKATGLDDHKELDAGTMLGYYGIGWELANIPFNYTHLEAAENATAKALKALRPDLKVGVTRNSVVATTFWDTARERMQDPASASFWLQCGATPCTAKWGLDEPCPGRPHPSDCWPTSYMFNWSDPGFQEWYVYEYIGEAANNSLIDAVYFDAGVDVSVAPGLDPQGYIRDSQATFDRAAALLRSKGKWASSWVGHGNEGEITNATCTATMEAWLRRAASGHTLVPITYAFDKCFRHPCHDGQAGGSNPGWHHSPTDQNNTVAAFMIARGPSALLQLHVHGAYAWAEDMHFPPILRADYGRPLAPAATVREGVYSREYERATLTLDCGRWESSFELKS